MKKELAPEWALLGLLTQKPMHGYEFHRYFTDPSVLGQVWYLGLSQMYKLLKELEGQGYLEVTAPGRAAFLQWMEKPVSSTRLIRVEFLAKLFLAQLLGSEMIERVIDTQLEACQAQLTRLLDAETQRGGGRGREWRVENGEGRRVSGEGFEHLVLRFRRGQIEAIIDWLKCCRRVFLEEWRIANDK
jgi:DNA-binding PadR family transcriptional regulator